MKRFIGLTLLTLFSIQVSQAQFLNKLKKKAEAVINKSTEQESEETNSDEPAPDQRSRKSGAEQAPASKGLKYCSPLFTLSSGERICYSEQSLKIVSNQAVIKVITKLNKEFYLYVNGEKSGPFKTAPVDQLEGWPFKNLSSSNDKKKTDPQPYLRSGVLTVDGKNIGNYMSIIAFYHNKEKKKFYGIAMNMEKNSVGTYFISNKGKRKLPMTGGELIISENDEIGAVKVSKTQFLAKTPEDQAKYVANDDYYLLYPDGTNKGPFPDVQARKSYLDEQGNFIELSSSRNTVYINGQEVLKLESGLNSEGKLFKSANATSAAWFERGNLFFTDGETAELALQPALSLEDGKTILNWITIKNNEVYACRKEL